MMNMEFKSTLSMDKANQAAVEGAERGLAVAMEYVLTESNKIVPHETGELERSGRASAFGMTGAVSYNTDYAVDQHENTAIRHDEGRRAKFLESAFTSGRDTIMSIIQTEMKARMSDG